MKNLRRFDAKEGKMKGYSGNGNFITIPFDARLQIVKLLNPKQKQALRQTCSFLAFEVDKYFGPSNCLNLHDRKSPEVLEFIGRTIFRTIKIPKRCFLDFDSVIHCPLKIQSISFNDRGIITSEFASRILSSCTNLKTLDWTGTIKGIIPVVGNPFILKKLESLKMDASPMEDPVDRNVFMQNLLLELGHKPYSEECIQSTWYNQLAILERLHLPNCKHVDLYLRAFENQADEIYDEMELATTVIKFLFNNPNIERFDAMLDNWRDATALLPERSFFAQKHNLGDDREPVLELAKRISNGKLLVLKNHTFNIKELKFEFIVSDDDEIPAGEVAPTFPGLVIQNCLIKFLAQNKFQGLRKLHLLIKTAVLDWFDLEKILDQNCNSLEHLEISAEFVGPINFEFLSKSPLMKILSLCNFGNTDIDELDSSPLAQNFGPYPNMIENLEELKLRNIRLLEEDVISLAKLKRFKKVHFRDWFGEDLFVPAIRHEVIVQNILLHRTLDIVEIRLPVLGVEPVPDQGMAIMQMLQW